MALAQMGFLGSRTSGLILAMIIAVVITIGYTGGMGVLQSIFPGACEKSPDLFFCDQSAKETANFKIATRSGEALACAINSVSSGDLLHECIKNFELKDVKTTAFTGSFLDIFTGKATEPPYDTEIIEEDVKCLTCNDDDECGEKCYKELCDDGKISGCQIQKATFVKNSILKRDVCECRAAVPNTAFVECTNVGMKYDCNVNPSEGGQMKVGTVQTEIKNGVESDDPMELCQEMILENGYELEGLSFTEKDKRSVVKCTVANFHLPQDIKDAALAKERIPGLGDPDFLLYYEIFPQGGDEWHDLSNWYEDFGQLMFIGLCLTHLFKPIKAVAGGAKNLITKPVSTITKAGTTAANKAKSAVKWLANKFPTTVNEVKMSKATITNWYYRRGLAKTMSKVRFNSQVVSHYSTKGGVGKYLDDVANYGGAARDSPKYKELETVYNNLANQGLISKDPELLVKYLPTETGKTIFSQIITKPVAKEAAFRTAAMMGLDIGSYFVLRSESELGKFIDQYPQSLVVQNTMSREDLRSSGGDLTISDTIITEVPEFVANPVLTPIMKVSRPIIIDAGFLSQGLEDSVIPLMFSSPCRATLEVYEKEKVTCSLYSYDRDSGLSECINPAKSGFLKDSVKGGIQKCGTLPNLEYNADTSLGRDGAWFDYEEYNLIYDGLNKRQVIGSPIEITATEKECCKVSDKDGGTIIYQWVPQGLCTDDFYEAGVLTEGSADYGNCLPKPSNKISVIPIFEPTSEVTFYYDPARNRIDEYDYIVVSESGSQKTERGTVKREIKTLYLSGGGFSFDENGNCEVKVPGTESILFSIPEVGVEEEPYLVCTVAINDTDLEKISFNRREKVYKIYGKLKEDGSETLEKFSAVSVDYILYKAYSAKHNIIMIRDSDLNGKMDILDHYSLTQDHTASEFTIDGTVTNNGHVVITFDEQDNMESFSFNGIDDSLGTTSGMRANAVCEIDAIAVKPDLTDVKGEYNYCYRREAAETIGGFAQMTAAFTLSSLVKVGKASAVATAASVALDCGMALVYHKFIKRTWPGNKG